MACGPTGAEGSCPYPTAAWLPCTWPTWSESRHFTSSPQPFDRSVAVEDLGDAVAGAHVIIMGPLDHVLGFDLSPAVPQEFVAQVADRYTVRPAGWYAACIQVILDVEVLFQCPLGVLPSTKVAGLAPDGLGPFANRVRLLWEVRAGLGGFFPVASSGKLTHWRHLRSTGQVASGTRWPNPAGAGLSYAVS